MTEAALIKTNAAARILGVSSLRVRQLDAELKPLFTEEGTRLYRRDAVEAYAAQREHRR